MISEPTDIGHGVIITPVLDRAGTTVIGLNEEHDRPDGSGRCWGFVHLDVPEGESYRTAQSPVWQVESTDPLTLSPSLLCRACGNHGYIRQGRWEPV